MDLATLRAELAQFDHLPGDTPVVMANSAEGNGFSPVHTIAPALYLAGSPYGGEWYADAAFRSANPNAPESEDEAPDGAVAAVFFWPTS